MSNSYDDSYYNSLDDYERGPVKPSRHRIITTVIFFSLISITVFLFHFSPTMTGNVAFDINRVYVNEMAYNNSEVLITADKDIPVRSAKLSGTILGNGSVKVYLAVDDRTRLVYSSKKERKSMSPITALAVQEINNNPVLNVLLDEVTVKGANNNILSGIKLMNEGYDPGYFVENMRISTLPESNELMTTGILLDGKKFWGYNVAGNPLGDQPLSTMLTGWGKRIADGEVSIFDDIEFNDDISGKNFLVEIFFREFLHGHTLGQERYVRIYLYLDGSKKSYVEGDGKITKQLVIKTKEASDEIKTGTGGTSEDSSSSGSSGSGSGSSGSESTGESGSAAGSSGNVDDTTEDSAEEGDVGAREITGNVINDFIGTNGIITTVGERDDGKIITAKRMNQSHFVLSNVNVSEIKIEVIDDPKYKQIFDEAKTIGKKTISVACDETCLLGLESKQYKFIFDVSEGTAVNITAIDFS